MTEFSMENFFNWPITRLTCIQTCAICLHMSTSFADTCDKAGILRTAHRVANYSSIKNRLSTRIQSPNVTLSKKPELSVISLSEALPPQPADKKLTVPDGVMPTKYLIVCLDLKLENVCALAFKLNGLSIKTSVQSIMHTQFLKFLKDDGRFLRNASLSGHTIKFFKISDRAFK